VYFQLRAPFQVSAFWGTLTARLRKEKTVSPTPRPLESVAQHRPPLQ